MTRIRKCKRCGQRPAEWAWQTIGGEDSFVALGWHYRGFPVTPVCEDCREEIKAGVGQWDTEEQL